MFFWVLNKRYQNTEVLIPQHWSTDPSHNTEEKTPEHWSTDPTILNKRHQDTEVQIPQHWRTDPSHNTEEKTPEYWSTDPTTVKKRYLTVKYRSNNTREHIPRCWRILFKNVHWRKISINLRKPGWTLRKGLMKEEEYLTDASCWLETMATVKNVSTLSLPFKWKIYKI